MKPRRTLTQADRARIWEGAAGKCHLCGLPIRAEEAWDADHIKARWKGGSDELSNYAPAHANLGLCHAAKSAAETKQRHKEHRLRVKHGLATPPPARPKQKIAQRPKEEKARVDKLPLPPRRPMFK